MKKPRVIQTSTVYESLFPIAELLILPSLTIFIISLSFVFLSFAVPELVNKHVFIPTLWVCIVSLISTVYTIIVGNMVNENKVKYHVYEIIMEHKDEDEFDLEEYKNRYLKDWEVLCERRDFHHDDLHMLESTVVRYLLWRKPIKDYSKVIVISKTKANELRQKYKLS